jgi:hypothetical protein
MCSDMPLLSVYLRALIPYYVCLQIGLPWAALAQSTEVPVAVDPPMITSVASSQTLLAGQPLLLKVNAVGPLPLNYSWKMNNRSLTVSVSDIISIQQLTLAHGGNYVVEVTNPGGKANNASKPIEIVVVDSSVRYLTVPDQANVTLKAVVSAGPRAKVSYRWKRLKNNESGGQTLEEISLTETPNVKGHDSAVMKISKITADNEGLYRCVVTGPDGVSVAGSDYDVRCYRGTPVFTGDIQLGDILLGQSFQYQVPINREDRNLWPEKITASGLPPGLSINQVTGLISGRPTATKPEGYQVTITAMNKVGQTSLTKTLNVIELDPSFIGSWVGMLSRNIGLGDHLGGRVDITVNSKASFTGRLWLGNASYPLKGALILTPFAATAQVEIKRAGKPTLAPLTVRFVLNKSTNTLTEGGVTDGVTTIAFSGWRNVFSKLAVASNYTGYYTLGLGLSYNSPLIHVEGSEDIPLGAGFATFTVADDGRLKMIGRMPDGEPLTQSLFVGPQGQLALYQPMYRALKPTGGSLLGELQISIERDTSTIRTPRILSIQKPPVEEILEPDEAPAGSEELPSSPAVETAPLPPITPDSLNSHNRLHGMMSWIRPMSFRPQDRAFIGGFGVPGAAVALPLEIVVTGGCYTPPVEGKVLLGMDADVSEIPVNNAHLDFYYGGDQDKDFIAPAFPTVIYRMMNPDLSFALIKDSKIVLSTDDKAANFAKTNVRAVAKTGLVSGSFSSLDLNPGFPMMPHYVRRTVRFQGVVIHEDKVGGGSRWVGVGFYLLPQLPDPWLGTTERTSPIFSGRFEFRPLE